MDISSILTDARSAVEATRKNAESILEKLVQADLFEFLKLLSDEMSNENKAWENRQLAATYIKNVITLSESERDKWLNFSSDRSSLIKRSILGSLASSIKEVRRSAGYTIAGKISLLNLY